MPASTRGNSFCKSELCVVRCGQLFEHVDYLTRRGKKKTKKFQDFSRKSGYIYIYCLFGDHTTTLLLDS